jgi:hypothetical protein
VRPTVTLVAVGAGGNNAVGSRIGAFTRGLGRRGWDVRVIDPASPSATMADRLLSPTPPALRSVLENAGIDGDVRPVAGWSVHLVMSGYWYGRNGPGILLDALKCVGPTVAELKCVGPTVAELSVIGGISPPIAAHLRQATGYLIAPHIARSRRALYERLHRPGHAAPPGHARPRRGYAPGCSEMDPPGNTGPPRCIPCSCVVRSNSNTLYFL